MTFSQPSFLILRYFVLVALSIFRTKTWVYNVGKQKNLILSLLTTPRFLATSGLNSVRPKFNVDIIPQLRTIFNDYHLHLGLEPSFYVSPMDYLRFLLSFFKYVPSFVFNHEIKKFERS